MSNYSPSWIDRNVWQIISATIRRYPQMYVELVDGEDEIINGHVPKEVNVSAGFISDPTASIAIKLATAHRIELNRKCEAINYCLTELPPEHYRVVCLRFWGVEDTGEAFRAARAGTALCGYKFESMRTVNTVTEEAGYSLRNAKRSYINLFTGWDKPWGISERQPEL